MSSPRPASSSSSSSRRRTSSSSTPHPSSLLNSLPFMHYTSYLFLLLLPFLHLYCSIPFQKAFWTSYLITYLDTHSYKDGTRTWPWFAHLRLWKGFCSYVIRGKVVCTTVLDNKKQYIIGAHPHGINTFNHFITMTNGCNFLTEHYSHPRRDLGATILFFIPLIKEILLWLGCVDAGAKTARKILKQGFSTLIFVGGEKEQILTQRGKDLVVIKPRKGFIRLALQHGCDLVPLYAFGENDLFFTFNYLKDFQLSVASAYKLAFPPCWGFIWPFWPLPVPLTVVVGAPIEVTQVAHPSQEQVDALQEKYIKALTALYETYKVKYGGRKADAMLEIR